MKFKIIVILFSLWLGFHYVFSTTTSRTTGYRMQCYVCSYIYENCKKNPVKKYVQFCKPGVTECCAGGGKRDCDTNCSDGYACGLDRCNNLD